MLTLLFIIVTAGISQTKDTGSVNLNEVVISSAQNKHLNTVKKTQLIDTLTKNNFNLQSVSDLLSVNTPVFIKNYGPANLSSAGLRGGNASQTPILWNGFNIQNPMLGQNDFSQLPSFIFDNIGIEYGGSAATWGSGAMGGSIHLNNKAGYSKGFHTLITMGLGSFNTKKLNTLLHYSNEKISTNTKVYYIDSDNNFDYIDTIKRKQIHANYTIKGLMQELSAIIFKNQIINVRAWYNLSNRNLPPVLGNITSKASQKDENLKLTADWSYQHQFFSPCVRIAYFDDILNYTDSASSVYSNNKTKTLIAEADVKYMLNKQHTIFAGAHSTSYKAITANYTKPDHQLNKEAILLGYNLSLSESKLLYEMHLRQEFSSAFTIPFTGNTGLSYQLFKELKLKVNAAKVYRLPTLNDLYWSNGGNPDLKPEEGYTYEGGFEFKWQLKQMFFVSEMTYFNKSIQNWISWVPGPGGYPTPINLAEVLSQGTETGSHISYSGKLINCKIGFNSAYVLSSTIKSSLVNDASVNKQLIYTPRYNYGANFSFSVQNFVMAYYHNYIGYRFTSSDNSTWLTPYNVANLKIAYKYAINTIGVTTFFQVHNLFNADYKVIAQRPMPLRSYEISLTLTYHKPKTSKQNNI